MNKRIIFLTLIMIIIGIITGITCFKQNIQIPYIDNDTIPIMLGLFSTFCSFYIAIKSSKNNKSKKKK